jgi:hypothetical protein
VRDQRHNLDGAEKQLREAKANESRHLAAVALGEIAEDMSPIKIAEHTVAEARTRCDATRRTRVALEQEARATEAEIAKAKLYAIEPAVRGVIASEAPVEKLLAEFAELRRDYVMHRRVIEWLESIGAVKLPVNFHDEPREWTAAARSPWEAAVVALATDADAPLPV